MLEPSFPDYLTGVVRALRTGDEESAVSTTRNYYERVDRQLMSLLHALAGTATPSEPPRVSEEPTDSHHEPMGLEHDGASEPAPIAH